MDKLSPAQSVQSLYPIQTDKLPYAPHIGQPPHRPTKSNRPNKLSSQERPTDLILALLPPASSSHFRPENGISATSMLFSIIADDRNQICIDKERR